MIDEQEISIDENEIDVDDPNYIDISDSECGDYDFDYQSSNESLNRKTSKTLKISDFLDTDSKKKSYRSLVRKLKTLRKIQVQYTKMEAEFYKEVHYIRCEFSKLYAPLYEKSNQIITGAYVPTESESNFLTGKDIDTECDEHVIRNLQLLPIANAHLLPGIPGFWLTVLKSADLIADMIQIHDEPVLMHLSNVTMTMKESNPMGFVINFHFNTNEYFTNSILCKEYNTKCEVDEKEPYFFDGLEVYSCKGCTINWNKGKDVTKQIIAKKMYNAEKLNYCFIETDVEADSFFNFFEPPICALDESMDDEDRQYLASDFEIGQFISGRIISRAVLFYTGEALDVIDDSLESTIEVLEESFS